MIQKTEHNTGWATLELVMSLPLIVFILGCIYYAGNLGFAKLHLTNAVDASARIAAVKGCPEGVTYVRASFPEVQNIKKLDCNANDDIEMVVTYNVKFPLTIMSGLDRDITVKAYALNELALKK